MAVPPASSVLQRDVLCCTFTPARARRILDPEIYERGESHRNGGLASHFSGRGNSGTFLETMGAIFLQEAKVFGVQESGSPDKNMISGFLVAWPLPVTLM